MFRPELATMKNTAGTIELVRDAPGISTMKDIICFNFVQPANQMPFRLVAPIFGTSPLLINNIICRINTSLKKPIKPDAVKTLEPSPLGGRNLIYRRPAPVYNKRISILKASELLFGKILQTNPLMNARYFLATRLISTAIGLIRTSSFMLLIIASATTPISIFGGLYKLTKP